MATDPARPFSRFTRMHEMVIFERRQIEGRRPWFSKSCRETWIFWAAFSCKNRHSQIVSSENLIENPHNRQWALSGNGCLPFNYFFNSSLVHTKYYCETQNCHFEWHRFLSVLWTDTMPTIIYVISVHSIANSLPDFAGCFALMSRFL